MIKMIKNTTLLGCVLLLTACGASNPPTMSEGHLGSDVIADDVIPQPVIAAPILPEPEFRPSLETYTVVVNQVPVRELLFSMARDAKLNIDIDSDIKGKVTMNAIDQTLPQILERLIKQADIDYKLEDDTLFIRADKPRLQLYNVNYLNMSRLSKGTIEVATEISSTGSEGGASGGNNSSSTVENESNNEFWKTLIINLAGVLGEVVKESSDIQKISSNIIVNRETGVIGVRATSKQHRQVRGLLDKVLGSAQRQVMIEATIAEVTLSDHYQAGIDWSAIKVDGLGNITDSVTQNLLGGNLGTAPFFQITGSGTNSSGDQMGATLKALETFGDVKVLSSPKVMAMNNQTAMLKVVDTEVYFLIDVEKGTILDGLLTPGTITTNIHTVPVGFVMSVMPFVDENDVVTLHVRPTISRIIGKAVDPNPALADADIVNEVPIIQVREIESVLKINSGDTAVIGGLMQDQINKQKSGVPILSSIPLIGALFSYQDDEYVKSELVIFIRPVVIHEASLEGDLKEYRKYLMKDFDASAGRTE